MHRTIPFLFCCYLILSISLPIEAENTLSRLDRQGVVWLHEDVASPAVLDVMEILTHMGDARILLGSTLLLSSYGAPERARVGRLLTAALGSTGIAVYGVKHLVDRDRPYERHSAEPSFPSGHTSMAFAAATVVSQEWPALRIPAYVMAGVVGASRVILGRHYPSDVLAGALLGTSFGYLTHRYRGYLLKIEF